MKENSLLTKLDSVSFKMTTW